MKHVTFSFREIIMFLPISFYWDTLGYPTWNLFLSHENQCIYINYMNLVWNCPLEFPTSIPTELSMSSSTALVFFSFVSTWLLLVAKNSRNHISNKQLTICKGRGSFLRPTPFSFNLKNEWKYNKLHVPTFYQVVGNALSAFLYWICIAENLFSTWWLCDVINQTYLLILENRFLLILNNECVIFIFIFFGLHFPMKTSSKSVKRVYSKVILKIWKTIKTIRDMRNCFLFNGWIIYKSILLTRQTHFACLHHVITLLHIIITVGFCIFALPFSHTPDFIKWQALAG